METLEFEVKREDALRDGDEWSVDSKVAAQVRLAGIHLCNIGQETSPARGMRRAWKEFWEKWRALG